MKRVYSAMLVLVTFFCGTATTKEIPMTDLKVEIQEVLSSGSVTVRMTNSSKHVIKLWEQSNSWGAACWRVLLLRKGLLDTFFQNPDQRFTRNIPTSTEIAGGGHIEQSIDLNGGNWCGFGAKKVSFAPNDLVIVVYDVPRTDEAAKLGVWYGVVATSTTVR